MEEELIRLKLGSTEEQIGSLKEFLANVKENRNHLSSLFYNSAVIGYSSKINELRKEILEYENLLNSV